MSVKTLVYLVIVLLVINVAAIGTIVYEYFNRPEMPFMPLTPRPGGGSDDWRGMRGLGLTTEQMERLRESRSKLREILQAEETQVNELRRRLMEEVSKSEPSRERVYQLVEEMGRIQTEIQKKVIDNIIEDGAVLEPQQREMLLRMLEQRAFQHRGPHPGQGRRPGRRGN